MNTIPKHGFAREWMYSSFFLLVFFLLISFSATAQGPQQQLRGQVTDQVLGTPVAGATVHLPDLQRTVTTDSKGEFRFADVPVGVYQLLITYIGYKEAALENIRVISGKETVITVAMENAVVASEAVVIKTGSRKNKPLNEMSAVSARAFSVEETQKYAAAVNDPLRMAAAFPGVFATDDGNNNISIRGNAPTGLLWRMEGVDIPNPNHFSSAGSTGGGISILSAQLLSNSDFMTGAFAAEYGNALSGVFDLKLRKGNNEKKEYTLQAGILGLNVAAEGPLMPFYKGSYLVNYRYSTLSLLDKIGVPLQGGVTNFQDLSFNVFLPAGKLGTFTLFGFGGLSSQENQAVKDSFKWADKSERYNTEFISNTAASGITHHIFIGSKTSLRSSLGYSYSRIRSAYEYLKNDYNLREDYNENYRTGKWTASTVINHKFSARSNVRAGIIGGRMGFDYYKKERESDQAPLLEVLNSSDQTETLQAFAQWQYRPLEQLTLNAGWHYLRLFYNGSSSWEPRASVKWQLDPKNSIAFGYGDHSQLQAMGVYFAQTTNATGQVNYPNKDLGLTRARHYVLSYQHAFNRYLSLKSEVYYQQLRNVPVSIYDSSSFSVLNIQGEYITDPLVNKGRGKNYGIELSLEKYLHQHFYYTISTSIYRSLYTAADGVERNTRFNGNYMASIIAGKDFVARNGARIIGLHVKTIYAGGLRKTPIDLERSALAGYAIYKEKEAFTVQNPDYFRTDFRVSLTWNRKNLTSTLSLDLQNVTNRLNVYGEWFDSDRNRIVTSYQTGLIPVLNYKVEF